MFGPAVWKGTRVPSVPVSTSARAAGFSKEKDMKKVKPAVEGTDEVINSIVYLVRNLGPNRSRRRATSTQRRIESKRKHIRQMPKRHAAKSEAKKRDISKKSRKDQIGRQRRSDKAARMRKSKAAQK